MRPSDLFLVMAVMLDFTAIMIFLFSTYDLFGVSLMIASWIVFGINVKLRRKENA